MTDARFAAAIAAIDEANAADPNQITVDGEVRPKEVVHAKLMTRWVLKLDPRAAPEQLLAARAHHLRRWLLARVDFDEGRSGYLRWRTELSKRHADDMAEIAERCGYDAEFVDRVRTIMRKQGLGSDAAVQVHEDALCLVFLETQFGDLVGRLGREKCIGVVAKTARKMSAAGLAAVAEIELTPVLSEVLAEAVERG